MIRVLLLCTLVTVGCSDDPPAQPPAAPALDVASEPVVDAMAPDIRVLVTSPSSDADVGPQGDGGGDGGDADLTAGDGGADDEADEGEGTEISIVMGTATFEVEEAPAAPKKARRKGRSRKSKARAKAKAAKLKAAKAKASKLVKAPPKRRAATALSTIRRHFGDIERCYGPVALKDPSIKGKIVVQWTLGRDGTPTATAILKNTLKNKSVAQCIRKRARTWKFPPPNGGVAVITYPFNLSVQ